MDRGIYVHIPFCVSKCTYCAFNSYRTASGVPDWYIDAIASDASVEASAWTGKEFATVYLGGGTPSLLRSSQLDTILMSLRRHFRLIAAPEITIEANPNCLTRRILSTFMDFGTTRLSVGIQSLSPHELEVMGRSHSAADALRALEMARDVGFRSVSADIMVGVPGQTPAGLSRTLGSVLDLVDHVSGYLLALEPGTRLDALVKRGRIKLPGEERVLLLYEHLCDVLTSKGFVRYEISNWCLPGHECLHNQVYWRRCEYAGLGAGAHSHKAGRRYARFRNPETYAQSIKMRGSAVETSENLTDDQMLMEEIMLGLRTARGIDVRHLTAKYGLNVEHTATLFRDLIRYGYAVRDGSNLLLSPKGIRVHDAVSSYLVSALTSATA